MSSSSTSPSTHQDAHLAPSLNTEKPELRSSKFIEGPMLDEPSRPPPAHNVNKNSSARSSSETKGPNSQTTMAAYRLPTRSVSEPVEGSSPKTMEKTTKK